MALITHSDANTALTPWQATPVGPVITRFELHRLAPFGSGIIQNRVPANSPAPDTSVATALGKPLWNAEASDLYNVNDAPGWRVLQKSRGANLTDEEGRMYWLAEDVNFNTAANIRRLHGLAMEANDIMFYVRPGKAKTERGRMLARVNPMSLPRISSHTPQIFQHYDTVTRHTRRMHGFVVDCGSDVPRTYASRKSSYVVVRDLVYIE